MSLFLFLQCFLSIISLNFCSFSPWMLTSVDRNPLTSLNLALHLLSKGLHTLLPQISNLWIQYHPSVDDKSHPIRKILLNLNFPFINSIDSIYPIPWNENYFLDVLGVWHEHENILFDPKKRAKSKSKSKLKQTEILTKASQRYASIFK